jgi:hypothetical protein
MTRAVPTPTTARTAVAFCADARFAPYALHAARDLRRLPGGDAFDILLCDLDPPEIPASLAPLGVRPVVLDGVERVRHLPHDTRRSPAMYARLLLADTLRSDYDRILYLDADVAIQGGDVQALLSVDLPRTVAAVRDATQWRSPDRHHPDFKARGLGPAPYFNSGVLLIDVRRWCEEDVLGSACAVAAASGVPLAKQDQTLLNVVFHRAWLELPPTWNWQLTDRSAPFEPSITPNIVHFIGSAKPWNDAGGKRSHRFVRATAAFLAEHFPDHPTPPSAIRPLTGLRLPLLRAALATLAMERYTTRFAHDLDLR